jgi:hypothetical protein
MKKWKQKWRRQTKITLGMILQDSSYASLLVQAVPVITYLGITSRAQLF